MIQAGAVPGYRPDSPLLAYLCNVGAATPSLSRSHRTPLAPQTIGVADSGSANPVIYVNEICYN